VTDTVGFIRKLPHHLVASFRATLEEAEDADLLLHVIDAAHPGWEEQVEVVEKEMRNAEFGMRKEMRNAEFGMRNEMRNAEFGMRNVKVGVERKRTIYVFNKADLLPDPDAFLTLVRERYPHALLTSSIPHSAFRISTSGVEDLRRALRTSAQALRPVAEIRVPISDGKLLATLHRDAEILHQEQRNGVVTLRARIEARLLGRLRQEGVEVVLG